LAERDAAVAEAADARGTRQAAERARDRAALHEVDLGELVAVPCSPSSNAATIGALIDPALQIKDQAKGLKDRVPGGGGVLPSYDDLMEGSRRTSSPAVRSEERHP
jgi:hypothetical protein